MTRNPLIPHRRHHSRKSGGGKAASAMKMKQQNPPQVTYENAEAKLEAFIKYYKNPASCQFFRIVTSKLQDKGQQEIGIVPEEEWDDFLKATLSISIVTFRISMLHRLSNIPMESRKGSQSQPAFLLDIFKKTLLPKLEEQILGDKQVSLSPIPWYRPHGYAWKANIDMIEFRKYAGLKDFADFIIEETLGFNVLRLDVHMMLPPMLVDIQPHHKILDMCAAPGFMSAAILECLYANPKKLPEGFLVANDVQKNHIQWRWTQGTNCIFLGHDARYLPELYMSKEHTEENLLRYDRILLDPPCSNDGNFRKTHMLRSHWKPNRSLECHKEQKQMLQRGLEVLAVGGELLYTTTSMHPAENEAVIAALLRQAPDSLELVDPRDRVPGFISRPGLSKWKIMGVGLKFFDSAESGQEWLKNYDDTIYQPSEAENEVFQLERCMRVVPQDNDSTAFFCAVIRKTAEIPWTSDVPSVVPPVEVSTDEKPMHSLEDLMNQRYIHPIEVCMSVHMSDMEWTTEVTNNKLETKVTTSIEKYAQPPIIVSDRSLNQRVKAELQKVKAYLTHEDESWKQIKSFYKLSNELDPTMFIKRNGGRARSTVYYWMHPIIKCISESNPQLARADQGLKNFGLKAFRVYKHELCPKCDMVVSDIGLMGLLPYLGARVVMVTKEDVVKLIQEKSLSFDQLSPKAQKAVEAMEPGCLVYYCKAVGKQADPNCDIAFVGWRNRTFVRSEVDQRNDDNHMLRLCGVGATDRKEKFTYNLLPEETVSSKADASMLEDDAGDDGGDDDVLMGGSDDDE